MKRKLFSGILLCCMMSLTFAQQNKEIKPLVSIEFEDDAALKKFYTLSGKDSLVEGISGKAR